MKQSPDVPSMGELALQYGTIDRLQLDRLLVLETRTGLSFLQLMKQEKMATEYQISLLALIQEFLVIKKQGEKFGQLAVERGFATREHVDAALKEQLQEFRKAKVKRLIGDILVASGVITPEQKEVIAREQKLLDVRSAMAGEAAEKPGPLELSPEVRHFLKIRDLDKVFAATVVEKGFATTEQVDTSLKSQVIEFKRQGIIRLLGDIMVEKGVLTHGQRDQILAEQNRMETVPVQEAVGTAPGPRIDILIADDAMEAWVEMPKTKEPVPTLAGIKAALAGKGINHGVLDALIQCCMDKKMPRFMVAKGDLPLLAGETEVNCLFETQPGETGENLPGARVERGEPLATLGRVETTTRGRDVFGNSVEKELHHRISAFTCGRGARPSKENHKVFAGTRGIPFLSLLGSLYVFPEVNVIDDADLKFGPIQEFSAIKVSGILTGAYPVHAGRVDAREIRGADIVSLGDISVSIGITNAVIKTQGSVRAKYIHNSTIEAFGDVIVDHEILDSTITISGRCSASKSRIIASGISAKGGVVAGAVGSDVTVPCRISAGREDHLVIELERIDIRMERVTEELDKLEKRAGELDGESKRLFEKMVEIKRFHGTAEQEREKARQHLETTNGPGTDPEREKTARLVKALDKRLGSSVNALKDLNARKKVLAGKLAAIKEKEAAVRPGVEAKVQLLEQERFALIEWSRKRQGVAAIAVKGTMARETVVAGQFSSTKVQKSCQGVKVLERRKNGAPDQFELVSKKL
ncbi:MAG: DUF342 domain-containing protein [Desulfobacteraceae bacterium]|nr:DUF342 domain-containing protein [Desulfobacteraceae bacterium]